MSIESSIPAIFSVSQFGETYLSAVNRQLFESQPSTSLYPAEYPTLFTKEHQLYVIIGIDSGLLANYVLEHPIPKGSRYLFIELDPVLAMMNIDIPTSIKGRVQVLSLDEFTSLIDEAPYPVYFTKKATHLLKSQAAKFAYVTDYISLSSQVEKVIEQHIFTHSIGLTQKQFIQRQLENLADNQIPAKVLSNSFIGKDCIILAGGPSLDEHLPWVIEHQDSLVIIAVSRISRRLLDVGLTPDIVVSVDPQEVSFDVSKEMLRLPKSVLFVNCYHVEPRLLANWHGQSVFLGERLPWEEANEASNIQTEGPTVTNSSLHLAIKMGFDRILLSGTDLCYASNGVTHAQGSHEAAIGANMVVNGEWVETYQGTKAETSIQMMYALDALDQEVRSIKSQQKVYNLSITAAKASGIPYIDRLSLRLQGIIGNKRQLLQLTNPLTAAQKGKYLADLTSQLKQSSGHLKDVVTLCEDALKSNAALKKAQHSRHHSESYYQSLVGHIDSVEKQLTKRFDKLCQLIKFFGFAEFTQFLTPVDSDEWQQKDMLTMTDAYYHAFIASSKQLDVLITNALARIAVRKAELNPQADVKELVREWDKFHQFGRAMEWQKLHFIAPEFVPLFDEMALKFNTSIDSKPKLAIACEKLNTVLGQVESKLLLLKRARNQFGLAQMAAILKGKAVTDKEAERLYRLAQSFSFELQGNPNKALDALLKLDEAMLTEREYKEMASLSLMLHKPSVAALALAKLTEYSDQYLPLYANALKLSGQLQQSADAYLKYLNRYPSEVLTWIKFGEFMIEAGERDIAITAFHQAEHAEPGNLVAKHYLSKLYQQ